jgi:NAD(P)-dependent dehydrogenase (short-subunit alcohol dehydrogenase family)
LLDRDLEGIEALAQQLPPASVLAVGCDVRDLGACDAAIDRVVDRWGGVDILVNNAGISHHGSFERTDVDVIRRVMDVNFYGAVHCTDAALPHIVERGGMIVVISSVAGFAPLVGRTGYAASKHALHGFFDSLRAELADRNAGVLIVCPSFTRTAIDASALSGTGSRLGSSRVPVGRLAEPDDVAAAIMRAIAARKRSLVLSPVGIASLWLSRLAPGLYARLMRATQSADRPEEREPAAADLDTPPEELLDVG